MIKNTKRHNIGDVVYIKAYLWPCGVSRYVVRGIKTETGSIDVYSLVDPKHKELTKSAWAFEVFDNITDAFDYEYSEDFLIVSPQGADQ